MNPIQYDFSGQVALVTGAASGMGLATARAFAEAGAAVALADIRKDALQAVADELSAAGHKVMAFAGDIADETYVKALVEKTVATFGRLDAAFNNAGIQSPAVETADVPSKVFDRITDINMRGVWLCMKYQLIQMRAQGSGAIVNNSSLGGLVGVPGRVAYHAAKHALVGMTKSAALEYADQGIRINAICPGIIDTPMVAGMLEGEAEVMNEMMKDVPIRRLGKVQEIADAVLWLCSPGSTFVVGVALPIDGGYTAR
ncbi:glucose 1-dehydrogenase [Pseudomonas aeruginosa]|uniref:glucose 1-dehydrogenase n=1 Tax=Pseudomonas aeruginosa TaxID=287 RepID=UPI0003B9B9FE|nr:glucose 1-dehydrogenase [Pseudomonas aeruginosa]EJM8826828.1 glucose 1-dehydrogenase [Pseudomonas aeruginosa]EKT8061451.1 glucose 1-dehydrogenase [Pseudomonas aeruginosa]EKU7998579.1 glucose 1-dehydrogenase [Pseudomonas aeruginosa]EKU8274998.1 glucose 1-dehydrogenase [Pseudomonas aeruginosa]EKV2965811.1 glucose 1-dehydrogenase [Pseudomonas aeruginosa]